MTPERIHCSADPRDYVVVESMSATSVRLAGFWFPDDLENLNRYWVFTPTDARRIASQLLIAADELEPQEDRCSCEGVVDAIIDAALAERDAAKARVAELEGEIAKLKRRMWPQK